MNPLKLLKKYFNSQTYLIIVKHSQLVKKKALEIAKNVPELKPDLQFIKEAAMLHDIGVCKTKAPLIGIPKGDHYFTHWEQGRKILEQEGLPKHALVAERHFGVSKKEIIRQNLPVTKKDFLPLTVEEEIIALADRFYTKKPGELEKERTIEEVRTGLQKFGPEPVKRFDKLVKKYKLR
ncbi:MAG: HDIG domain-containing protein [Nanoarchaeota archaeon]|nr:HDIG domain-containing protein [Nanoarchaeota archaeon]